MESNYFKDMREKAASQTEAKHQKFVEDMKKQAEAAQKDAEEMRQLTEKVAKKSAEKEKEVLAAKRADAAKKASEAVRQENIRKYGENEINSPEKMASYRNLVKSLGI